MNIEGKRAVVTGGSRGVGLGIVEALVERKAKVTVVARDAGRLAEVAQRLGIATIAGDITDETFANRVVGEVKPEILVLNAGRPPVQGPIHKLSWEQFSAVWEHDTKAGLFWIQAALKLPLPRGSRVLVTSSGAAVSGSPMSGGYAGAKKMLWFMAKYANVAAKELDLGVTFQALVQRQIIPGTGVGKVGAEAYAKRSGKTEAEFYAGFGQPLTPRDIGGHVVSILEDEALATPPILGFKGDTGVVPIED